jgi:hypothetical protein
MMSIGLSDGHRMRHGAKMRAKFEGVIFVTGTCKRITQAHYTKERRKYILRRAHQVQKLQELLNHVVVHLCEGEF